ncbi:hypothetical protein RvY_16226 [Ramazzottius varieornatus]|uniref:Uncharacterized protein n=1 Tax=Ramazzottius varieornatus TaxID=947166 RepID=A0A1D1VYN3_RAMVA|nr:hypothetical protein RvY_16226 [Ramazzottius varieornatus]
MAGNAMIFNQQLAANQQPLPGYYAPQLAPSYVQQPMYGPPAPPPYGPPPGPIYR